MGIVALTGDDEARLPEALSAKSLQADAGNPGDVMRRTFEAMQQEDLSDEQRRQLRHNAREAMHAIMDQRLDEYFSASGDEQVAILDRHIDEMQKNLAEWRERRAEFERQRASEASRQSDAGGPAPSAQGRLAGDGPAAGGPPPDGGRIGGRRSPPTREERKARSESRDPDQMARRMAYFTAMRQRAEERGIEMPFGHGGPGGGPGWRGGGPGRPR